jgi:hypothetical protein
MRRENDFVVDNIDIPLVIEGSVVNLAISDSEKADAARGIK